MRGTKLRVEQLRQSVDVVVRMLARRSIKVTQMGAQAYCKYNDRTGELQSVNIPMIPDKPTETFLLALQGFIDHECAHALFTDSRAWSAGRDRVAKDGVITATQISSAINIVEDVRIEREMGKLFEGSQANLSRLQDWLCDLWSNAVAHLGAVDLTDKAKTAEMRSMLFVPWMRSRAGQHVCAEWFKTNGYDALFTELDGRLPTLADDIAAMKSTEDAVILAEKVVKACEFPPPPPAKPAKEDKGEKSKEKGDKPDQAQEPQKDNKPDPDADEGEGEPDEGEDEDASTSGAGEEDEADDETEDEAEGDGKGEEPNEEPEADEEDADEGTGSGSDDDEDDTDEADDASDDSAGADEGDEVDAEGDDSDADGDAEDGDAAGDSDSDGDGPPDGEEDDTIDAEDGEACAAPPSPLDLDWSEMKELGDELAEAMKGEMKGGFVGGVLIDFTREYDRVEPYTIEGPAPDIRPMEDRVRKLAGTMQAHLRRIIVAKSQSYPIPGFRSGKLNGPALHRITTGDDRLFKRKHIADTNKVAVELVVDCSGSMGGEKIMDAMISAWAFSEVLDKLKVPNEVIGFTTGRFPAHFDHDAYKQDIQKMARAAGVRLEVVRWPPIYMPIFKGWGEAFTNATKQKMCHAANHGMRLIENDDATAIKIAGERLASRPETRKIMIVFSDGQPSQSGIDTDVLNGSLKTAVKNLTKDGIECIGIGIQSQAVRAFYPKCHVIDNPEELPRFVVGTLEKLLTER